MNTNRSAVLNVHSQWLLGSNHRPWCSVSWSLPRGQIWGWAQIQWAALPLLWWISSSSSWRSLQDSKWGTITASIVSKSDDGLPSATSNGVSVAFVTLPCCFEDAALGSLFVLWLSVNYKKESILKGILWSNQHPINEALEKIKYDLFLWDGVFNVLMSRRHSHIQAAYVMKLSSKCRGYNTL